MDKKQKILNEYLIFRNSSDKSESNSFRKFSGFLDNKFNNMLPITGIMRQKMVSKKKYEHHDVIWQLEQSAKDIAAGRIRRVR